MCVREGIRHIELYRYAHIVLYNNAILTFRIISQKPVVKFNFRLKSTWTVRAIGTAGWGATERANELLTITTDLMVPGRGVGDNEFSALMNQLNWFRVPFCWSQSIINLKPNGVPSLYYYTAVHMQYTYLAFVHSPNVMRYFYNYGAHNYLPLLCIVRDMRLPFRS